jgi:hypothetical protein
MTPRILPLFLLAAMLITALLAIPVSAEGSGSLVPNDILQMEKPGHFTLSQDGGNLVYIKSLGTDLTPPQGNGTLMYINVRSANEIVISDPAESVTSYALSPDGFHVLYTAMPCSGGVASLYLTSLTDRSRTRLNNVTDELADSFSWLGTDRLVFLGTPDNTGSSSIPGDVIVVDEVPAPAILKTYSIKDGTISPLTVNNDVITIWAPSPDGRYVLYKA